MGTTNSHFSMNGINSAHNLRGNKRVKQTRSLSAGLVLLASTLLTTASGPLLASTAVGDTPAPTSNQLLDRIISTVNDDVILQSELNQRIKQITQQIKPSQSLPPREILIEQVLDRMILETIQLQMAEQMGIRISDNELNDSIRAIASQNGLDLDGFQNELTSRGIAYADFRRQIQRDMLLSQVQKRRVGARIQVTDQDANTFLSSPLGKQKLAADYRIHHILIALSDTQTAGSEASQSNAPASAKAKADTLYETLKADPSLFESLALEHSDSQTALEGGDLGWRPVRELPTLFADEVITMSVGDISSPIKSASGYHLIRLTDRRGATEKMVHQLQVRHILIKPNEIRSDQASQQLIEEIHTKLLQGEPFDSLAQTYSDDPGSARQGGNLGWVSPGQMVPKFEQVMNQTALNQIAAPFRTSFGWHILQVTDSRTEDFSDEFRAAQAKNFVYKRRFEEELPIWLREVRQEAFVEYKAPIKEIAAQALGQPRQEPIGPQ